MKRILLTLVMLCFSVDKPFAAEDEWSGLQKVIAGTQRSAAHKARDQYRHPLETLQFFEVKNNLSVLELWPGAEGWYTEILAPYLKAQGNLTVANFSADPKVPYYQKNAEAFKAKLLADPKLYGKLKLTTLQPPDFLEIAPEASMDRVLTFRNVHNWMHSNQALPVSKPSIKP